MKHVLLIGLTLLALSIPGITWADPCPPTVELKAGEICHEVTGFPISPLNTGSPTGTPTGGYYIAMNSPLMEDVCNDDPDIPQKRKVWHAKGNSAVPVHWRGDGATYDASGIASVINEALAGEPRWPVRLRYRGPADPTIACDNTGRLTVRYAMTFIPPCFRNDFDPQAVTAPEDGLKYTCPEGVTWEDMDDWFDFVNSIAHPE